MNPINRLSDAELLELVQRVIAWPDAPPRLVHDVLEFWRVHRPREDAHSLPQCWFAVLRFDSWDGVPIAAGVRALPSEIRHLLFEAEACDIDLRIAPAGDGFALSGQLLGHDDSGRIDLTELRAGGEPVLRHGVEFDALSEFRIEGVGRGTYRVTVHLGSGDIVLPPIDVGTPRDEESA